MELYTFARFHARAGQERMVEHLIREGQDGTRKEPGCLSTHVFRSTRDARLFYIHARWRDEAAFNTHAELPHTVHFIARVEPLIDHPLDVTRTTLVAWSAEGAT